MYMHVQVCHACMYACMYVCMYMCMYACMHACMHIWLYVCACMNACVTSIHVCAHMEISSTYLVNAQEDLAMSYTCHTGHEGTQMEVPPEDIMLSSRHPVQLELPGPIQSTHWGWQAVHSF